MAIRLTARTRIAVAGLVSLAATLLLLAPVASAKPSHPKAPATVPYVQQQLGALALKNTQLVEKYDQAQVAVAANQKAADAAQHAAASSQAQYNSARLELSQTVAAQYEGGTFSATGALLSSTNGQSYLDELNTLSMVSAHTAQVVGRLSDAHKSAASAQQRAADLLAGAKAKRDSLAKQKNSVQGQIDKYKTLLATLTSAQRAAYQRSLDPSVSSATLKSLKNLPKGGSKAAQTAVAFALKQVGKPYVFGSAGPNSFDCSGLTMAAWHAAGVSLPHSAADQYNYGTHVSMSQLQPGDLVFYYHPIGHVTIYIGSGMMVSAPQTGEDVSVVPLRTSSYAGATRLA